MNRDINENVKHILKINNVQNVDNLSILLIIYFCFSITYYKLIELEINMLLFYIILCLDKFISIFILVWFTNKYYEFIIRFVKKCDNIFSQILSADENIGQLNKN